MNYFDLLPIELKKIIFNYLFMTSKKDIITNILNVDYTDKIIWINKIKYNISLDPILKNINDYIFSKFNNDADNNILYYTELISRVIPTDKYYHRGTNNKFVIDTIKDYFFIKKEILVKSIYLSRNQNNYLLIFIYGSAADAITKNISLRPFLSIYTFYLF